MSRAIPTAVLVSVALLVAAGCALPVSRPADRPRAEDRGAVTMGRIIHVVQCDGYIVVDFPWGRTTLSMDNRELAYLRPGETVAFDRNLRPIWSARPGA